MGELIRLEDRTGIDANWHHLKLLVLNTVRSPHTRRAYNHGLDDYRQWHASTGGSSGPFFSKAAVNAFKSQLEARDLASSTINIRLSAVRRLAVEAADNGLLSSELAGAIGRVAGAKSKGVRTGNWLTLDQAEQFLAAPAGSDNLTGKRDRALLALLIGCGLRRSELAGLDLDHIQQRDGRWCVVDLEGKGGKIRTVPMPAWAKTAVDAWLLAAGITGGRVFRPVIKGGARVRGEQLNSNAIWAAVRKYAAMVGLPHLAPHDCRRTFAKLGHKGGAPLEQIQLSLGHSSIQTTERYLGTRQDLADAPCDHLGIKAKLPSAA
jgi:integrase/recombinase XerD